MRLSGEMVCLLTASQVPLWRLVLLTTLMRCRIPVYSSHESSAAFEIAQHCRYAAEDRRLSGPEPEFATLVNVDISSARLKPKH